MNYPQKILPYIDEEKGFFLSLYILLDHQNFVIRGKTIISFYLILKNDLKYLKNISEGKFFILVEKMMKDNSKYVPFCLQHLIVLFDEIVPNLLKIIENEFRKSLNTSNEMNIDTYEKKREFSNNSNTPKANIKIINSNFNFLSIIFQVLNTQIFKLRYLTPILISSVFGFWEYCADNKLANKVIKNIFFINKLYFY